MPARLQIHPEDMILELLRSVNSLTMEQVTQRLPELSWSELFHAVDTLSRKGFIILRRRGFEYELAVPESLYRSRCLDSGTSSYP